jgi:proline iminopeptidase
MTLIGNHYERNNFFAEPNQLYRDLHKIKDIPVYMVQGRYDMVTPMVMAWRVYQKLNQCRLVITRGGHTHWEKDTSLELCRASDGMAETLQSEKPVKKQVVDKSRFQRTKIPF